MLSVSLAGLPNFLAYFASGSLLLIVFAFVYLMMTPHAEMTLIRQGNVAAAIGFLGALLGFTLVLSSAISHSIDIIDMLLWAGIGLLVQLFVLLIVRRVVPDLFHHLEAGNVAVALMLAGVSLAAGMINAASMSY